MERIVKPKDKSVQNKSSELSELKSLFQTSIQVLDTLLRDYQKQLNISMSNEFINNYHKQFNYNQNQHSLNSCFQNFYQRLKFILSYKKNSQNNQQFLDSLFVDSEQKHKLQNNKGQKLQGDEELYALLYQMKAQCKQQKKEISQLNLELNDKKMQINKSNQYFKSLEIKLRQQQKVIKTNKQTQKDLTSIKQKLSEELKKIREELQYKQSMICELQGITIEKSKLQDMIMKVNMKNVQQIEHIQNLETRLEQQGSMMTKTKQINEALTQQLKRSKQLQDQLSIKLDSQIKKRIDLQKVVLKKLWILKNQEKQNNSQLMNQVQTYVQNKIKSKDFIDQCVKKQLTLFVKNVSKLI